MADLIQQIVAREESNISYSTQNMYISLLEYFYCDLLLYEKVVGDNWAVAEDQQTIWPGKEYRVGVSLSQNRSHSPNCVQYEIKVNPEIQVNLICTESEIAIANIDSDCSLSKDKTISFTFTVPQCCPRCEVTFTLSYNEPANKDIRKLATSMSIELKGTYNTVDPVFVEHANVDLNSPLPEYVAMLYVEYQEEERFCLRGWNLREEPIKCELCGWRPKKLADILAIVKSDHAGDVDVWGIIHKFSRHRDLQKLNQWFGRLITSYGKQLCVVISEHNDLEIPWEILPLDHKNYLGSRAMVVRWREVMGYSELRKLRISRVKKQGAVVAYFNDQEPGIEVSYPEQEHLEDMQSKSRMRVRSYARLKDLRQYLRHAQNLHDIGLVYLGCYGNESMDTETRKKLFNPIKKLQLAPVEEHIDPRPLVFVNACDSACISNEDNEPMDVWLAFLASGYIGTCGPVGPTYASKVAKCVMEANGRSIAEVLKQLRVEAVQKSLQNEDVQEEFIYAFMYIYYGNPLLYLDLKDGKEPEENV
jgi:hypothetical protein